MGSRPCSATTSAARITQHRFAAGPGRLDWGEPAGAVPVLRGRPSRRAPAGWRRPRRPRGGTSTGRARSRRARWAGRRSGPSLELALGLTAWKEHGGVALGPARQPLERQPPPDRGVPARRRAARASRPGVHHYARAATTSSSSAARPTRRRVARSPRCCPGACCRARRSPSIHWREAWKYGERAFRYCQHDAGHAIASVRFRGGGAGLVRSAPRRTWRRRRGRPSRTRSRRATSARRRPRTREHPDGLVVVAPERRDRRGGRGDRARPSRAARGASPAGRGPERRTPSARSTWSGRRSPRWRPRP